MARPLKIAAPKILQGSVPGNGTKREPKQYTGTLLVGISTMHKSNSVPITSKAQAKEHAEMRRT